MASAKPLRQLQARLRTEDSKTENSQLPTIFALTQPNIPHMLKVHMLPFNPFQENTVLAWDETGDCLVVDPGCSTSSEEQALSAFIESNGLNPVRLINTHCHIDHVYGNGYVAQKWNLGLEIHELEIPVLERAAAGASLFGAPTPNPSPEPSRFIQPGETITVGNTSYQVLFVPGHCPGHIALYSAAENVVISGDVIFYGGGYGRTDLPGGDAPTLAKSIREVMLPLPPETTVYPGHGPTTTIGDERNIWMNP